jgi:hypothetical protein
MQLRPESARFGAGDHDPEANSAHFRHLLGKHNLRTQLFAEQNRIFDEHG